jgi:hypothetical protein
VALGKEWLWMGRLLVGQAEKIAHQRPRQFGSLTHADQTASGRLMDPDPKFDRRTDQPAQASQQRSSCLFRKDSELKV